MIKFGNPGSGGHLKFGLMLSSVHPFSDEQLQEHGQLSKKFPIRGHLGWVLAQVLCFNFRLSCSVKDYCLG